MTCIGQAHTLSINRHPYCVCFISGLLGRSCPATIFRKVSFLVINTIYGMAARWFRPHVFNKVFKFFPSFANRYSSIYVARGIMPITVPASRKHALPTSIFAAIFSVRRMTVRSEIFPGILTPKTSAALHGIIFKVFGMNGLFSSTVTPTQPLTAKSGYYNEPPETLISSIYKPHSNENVSEDQAVYKCPICNRYMQKDYAWERWHCACGWVGPQPLDREEPRK